MATHTIYKLARPKSARYTRRKRSLPVITGQDADGMPLLSAPVDAHVTRFGYQISRYRRPHDVYILPNGTLAEIKSVAVHMAADGKPDRYAHVYVPCARRTIRDRYPHKPIALDGAIAQVVNGAVHSISALMDGERFTLDQNTPGFEYAVEQLGLM